MWPTALWHPWLRSCDEYRLKSADRLRLPHGLPRFSTEKRGSEGGQVKIKLALVREKNLSFEWRGSGLRTGLKPIGLAVKKLQSRANTQEQHIWLRFIVQYYVQTCQQLYKSQDNKHR
jgi:hypothetical protein